MPMGTAHGTLPEFRDRFGTDFVPRSGCRRLVFAGLSQWAGLDSNQRPTDYESAALTAELPAPGASLGARAGDGPRRASAPG
jgi:hypothetical protein